MLISTLILAHCINIMIENGKENSTPNIQPIASRSQGYIEPQIKNSTYEIWNTNNGSWFSTSVTPQGASTRYYFIFILAI